MRNACKVLVGKSKGRDITEDPVLDVRLTDSKKLIFKTKDGL